MAKPTYEELEAEVERLRAEVARLTGLLEEAVRSSKRQAAPFSKGRPKAKPKKPGRKAGSNYGLKARRQPPKPEEIDETHQAALPNACPECGGVVEATGRAEQFQTEVRTEPIERKFDVAIGCCQQCGRRVQGTHPLQTSDALGAANAGLGAVAQSALAILRKEGGLSDGKVARIMTDLFGLRITRGGVSQSVSRLARKLKPQMPIIDAAIRNSPMVVPDETGYRIGGAKAWAHAFVTTQATRYVIDRGRGAEVAEAVLGRDYHGTMVHDGWSPYNRFENAVHQQCCAHALRRAREMLDRARGAARRFPQQIKTLFQNALAARDETAKAPEERRARIYQRFTDDLAALVARPRRSPSNRRFAKHLAAHIGEWFAFLLDPTIDATNWRAEQAMRPVVVQRKVWGGVRTQAGARVHQTILSVFATLRQQSIGIRQFLEDALLRKQPLLQLPPT